MAKKWPEYLTDPGLSLRGKGLMAIIEMQVKDPQRKFSDSMLEGWISDGGAYVQHSLQELMAHGYLLRRLAGDITSGNTITIYSEVYKVVDR